MNAIEALVKTILLLASEYKHGAIESIELAIIIRDHVLKQKDKHFNGEAELLNSLLNVLNDIIENGINDINSLASSLGSILIDRPALSTLVLKDLTEEVDAKAIYNRKKEIGNFINFLKLKNIISVAEKRLNRKNVNIYKLANEVINELQDVIEFVDIKDEAIINEVDFDSEDDIVKAVESSSNLLNTSTVLKTGWKCINEMLQGGLRRGEFVMISALPHNYKSGFVKSLFLQLARLNDPVMNDKNKKPLMLFFSFEEELSVVMLFFYAYLKYLNEGIAINPEKANIDKQEMVDYLRKYLKEDIKYNIKVIRMDPSQTTYKKIVKIIDEYGKKGFEIHAVFADYLSQISTEGCTKNGPAGVEYKDLYKRMRNEMSRRNILFVTPHQLSTEAKRLIRNGIPAIEFVKHLPGKGYYAHSGQLDQEVDLEIFLAKAYKNRKPYLTVQRGKHRIPTVIDEEKLYTMLEFPKGAPIPEDRKDEDGNCITNCVNENVDEDFGF